MGLFQSVPFMWRGAAGRAERLPERGTVHPSAPRELLGGLAISLSHSDTLLFGLGAFFDLLAALLCWRCVT